MEPKIVDHLFRHQYGKMVAILANIFGLTHLEMIEDAIQDTFIKATLQWRKGLPENPEGWLMKAAKNRVIDLIRQIQAEKNRYTKITSGAAAIHLNELFLDHEIQDSQLRMIFVACHPALSPEEQIAFALKTISGFSMKEIASALLLKDETIKKRLARARKAIVRQNLQLSYPEPQEVNERLSGVLQTIYLIFNEGYHSTKNDQLINKDLCGEALRLCRLLLSKENFRSGSVYALFALLCFHSSRLESKINAAHEIVDLEHQDRSKWYLPLIVLGNDALRKAMEYEDRSAYHFEAAIAAEHVRAIRFEQTDWDRILALYQQLHDIQPTASTLLSMATIQLQRGALEAAKALLDNISQAKLARRDYLLQGCYAEYYLKSGNEKQAIDEIEKAIHSCSNELEKEYLTKKKKRMIARFKS